MTPCGRDLEGEYALQQVGCQVTVVTTLSEVSETPQKGSVKILLHKI